MAKYVAFLRAVNVAGHAVVRKEALQEAFEEAGCTKVRTVLQSGNVIFEGDGRSAGRLFARIRYRLGALLGGEVAVAFRKADEIHRLVLLRPFGRTKPKADSKLYVCFFARAPQTAFKPPVVSEKEGLELVGLSEGAAFVISHRIEGKAMYGFPNAFVEKLLAVPATTRNWSTVLRVASLLDPGKDG